MKKLIKNIENKLIEVDSACSDLEKAIKQKYDRDVIVSFASGGEVNVEFENGKIWEWGSAEKILKSESQSKDDGSPYQRMFKSN